MKHAYCIIVHDEPLLFENLISMIDDERNDIYVLIDKKADATLFQTVHTEKSKISFIHNVEIHWGTFSQVEAELAVFSAAHNGGDYSYFHLLSGKDLPIKSQDEIHTFIERNGKKEYLGIHVGEDPIVHNRTGYYYFFLDSLRTNSWRKSIQDFVVKLQKRLNLKRNIGMEPKRGCNWCSITNGFCQYLLEHVSFIREKFQYMPCVDEIYKQTLFYQSPFYENIFSIDNEYKSCMRKIDWSRGKPYTWTKVDLDELMESDRFFARKFSENDLEIVQLIKRKISNTK